MQLHTTSFENGGMFPARFAFARIDPVNHVALSDNLNPALQWSEVPAATQSLVLICHDPDAPAVADAVNQVGKIVPHDLPRGDFFHWVLVDIPPTRTQIAEGEFSQGVVTGGKSVQTLVPMRHGINDYTAWFAQDVEMQGQYYGYDGACPPWNDERVHRYVFTLYALSVPRCPLEGVLNGAAVREAIAPLVLAQAQVFGRYSLHPVVAKMI